MTGIPGVLRQPITQSVQAAIAARDAEYPWPAPPHRINDDEGC